MSRIRLVAFLIAIPSLAHAEPEVGRTPFATLDRVDGRTRGGVELALGEAVEFGDFSETTVTTLRLEAHGQWVDRKHGLGGYVTAGLVKPTYGGEGKPIGFPAIELGGLSARRFNEKLDLVTHLGIAHKVRDSDDDSLAPFFGSFVRITDLARYSSHPTWLRLTASPVFRSGPLVARLDVGIDSPLGEQEGFSPFGTLLRLGAGVGIQQGMHGGGFEVVMVSDTNETSYFDHPVRGAIGSVAATYRLRLRNFEIYAAIVSPIEAEEAHRSVIVGVDVWR